jgi:hypothetical protein
MLNNIIIYSISCPYTNQVRYIGKSKDYKTRIRKHLSSKLKTRTSKWIHSLKDKPVFDIIDEVNEDNWQAAERSYIRLFKSIGCQLYNHTIGGEGGNTMGGRKLTLEQRQKISLSKIGKPNYGAGKWAKEHSSIKVCKYDLNDNYICTYNSIKEAAASVNRSDRRIQAMLKYGHLGGRKINHVAGFKFKYETNNQTNNSIRLS